jgi:alpha-tubulin suppressor-like RCC1 family protein
MPTYDGTYKLAVEDGRVLIRDVEGGSQSTHVPLEIYSNYAAQSLSDSRQLRLRTQPYLESNAANAYVTDMGIESGQTDNYFFITAPQKTANAGDRSTFVISKTSNVGIGTTNPEKPLHVVGDSWVTGTLTASNIVGASPVTISSNLVMASGFTLTAGAIEPPAGSETTLKGGTTASITNSNAFPNFIFSRSSNVAANHVGGAHNTARHVVFPSEDGKVWAVGSGEKGALGLGDTTFRNVYTLVSALDGVANIVASSTSGGSNGTYEGSVLLDDTGNVWTFGGGNFYGMLGHGDNKERNIPTLVTTNIYSGVSITEVSCGINQTLLLDSTGQIWGAGFNSDYRTGDLSGSLAATNSTFIPSMPAGTHTFTSVEAGDSYSLALEDNGRIWSTGQNAQGQTGQGTSLLSTTGWTQVVNTGGVNDVSITQISTGFDHSMALDSTGNVWMTGDNQNGQLGLGDTSDRLYFERVTTNVNVESGVTAYKIAAGVNRSYVLDTAGRMWGCGWNSNGNIGNPPYVAGPVTTFIRADAGPIADKSVTDFALSNYAAVIARTSDNEYYVTGFAGSGAYGSIGTGDNVDRFIFTKLLDVNANPPPDYGYTRSLLLENTETGKGPSIELKNKNAVSSRIQMEDGASGKLNIGFVDASFDPKLSGGDGAELYPFQERAQSNTMTRGVTINQAGGTMVAGGSTSNIGFNTPIFSSGFQPTVKFTLQVITA